MDDGLIESFAAAAGEVLGEIGLEVARVVAPSGPAPAADEQTAFVATVGILGDARGSLLLRLDRPSAVGVVAAMYRSVGMEHRRPAEVAEADIAELANQICGRAVTILSREGVECDITPPAVITGHDLQSSLPASVGLSERRVEGSFGSLVILVGRKA
jgi:CheY-specific phosphatase CheX